MKINLNLSGVKPRYLINPYLQLSAWMLYRIYDPQMGEKMLTKLLGLKEFLIKLDSINKQRFKENFDNWTPYNVWVDIIISQHINKYIDKLKENISLKKQYPQEFFSYYLDFYTVYRMIYEKTVFSVGEAFPDELSKQTYESLCDSILKFDSFLRFGDPNSGGMRIEYAFYYITDHLERERNFFEQIMLDEPDVYPTYLVYPKAYKLEQKVEQYGVYLPDSPLKALKLYDSRSEKFDYSFMHVLDKEKLTTTIRQIRGFIEYGLYEEANLYYNNPLIPYNEASVLYYGDELIETNWYYVQEIPPNTEGIPNNPLRLNDLRYPLKAGETYKTLEQIKKQYGSVYQNQHAMVEQYFQVVNRYEKYYRDYLLNHGVNSDLLLGFK